MKKHQKRISAPRSWPVERKTHKWAARPRAGPHSMDSSVPLLIVVRDMLNLADNSKEAKRILHDGRVLINGKIRKDHKFPVGVFDILSIPIIKSHYRMLPDRTGKLALTKIKKKDASTKLCRVENKTALRGGGVQLNLHDGCNVISSDNISTGDSVVLSLKDGSIVDHFPYQVGSKAMVIGGQHSRGVGTIKDIRKNMSSLPNMVSLEEEGGSELETIEEYIFVVGKDKVEIDLEGAS